MFIVLIGKYPVNRNFSLSKNCCVKQRKFITFTSNDDTLPACHAIYSIHKGAYEFNNSIHFLKFRTDIWPLELLFYRKRSNELKSLYNHVTKNKHNVPCDHIGEGS